MTLLWYAHCVAIAMLCHTSGQMEVHEEQEATNEAKTCTGVYSGGQVQSQRCKLLISKYITLSITTPVLLTVTSAVRRTAALLYAML